MSQMCLASVVLQKKRREDFSRKASHPLPLSNSVGSSVADPVNRDILLAAILTSRVACVSMRDWTSSVVGRNSSCNQEKKKNSPHTLLRTLFVTGFKQKKIE